MIPNTEYFNSRFAFDKNRDIVWDVLCTYFQNYVKKDDAVLDLGAGYCTFINKIICKKKYAVDLFKDLKKYAHSDVICRIGSTINLKFLKEQSVDVAFASNFFEHLYEPDFYKTLFEIRRVLRKRGKLLILQPNFKYCYRDYFDDYTHKTIFTEKSMKDILTNNNFKIIKLIPKFLPFSMKSSQLPISKILLKLYLISPIKPFAGQMFIVAEKQ